MIGFLKGMGRKDGHESYEQKTMGIKKGVASPKVDHSHINYKN